MTRGSRTPEDQEIEFRKHYLVTGNVAGAARAAGLAVNTGYELRKRALDDPLFVTARDEIRASIGPDLEMMLLAAMQVCQEGLSHEQPNLEKLVLAGATRVSYQDSRPQFAASLAKLYQALIGGKRFDAERNGEIVPAREVMIRVSGPATVDDANPG